MRPGIENLLLLVRRKIVSPVQSVTLRTEIGQAIQSSLFKSSAFAIRRERLFRC